MSQFTVYSSADASAPTLNGTTGSLVTVLDAILVNGYGAKSAAGWTKAYSGTSKAAYRMGSGTQFYLRVQDDGPGAATFQEARITGYETMSDVDTGSGLFGGAISSAFMVVRKSAAANSTARSWIAFADAQTLYLFILSGDLANGYTTTAFGDIYSLAAGDSWRCSIIGRATENSATITTVDNIGRSAATAVAVLTGHYLARSFGGGGSAIQYGKHGDGIKNGTTATLNNTSGAANSMPQPNTADNAYYLSPIWVTESSGIVRGWMRGMWQMPGVAASFSDGQTINGANDLSGKTFQCVKNVFGGANTENMLWIETSNTVSTN